MYGTLLARGPQDQWAAGSAGHFTGEVALIVPTVDIRTTGETHTIDGVEIEFQMAPGTEAPAEMHFYFPRFRLCAWPRTPLITCITADAARRPGA